MADERRSEAASMIGTAHGTTYSSSACRLVRLLMLGVPATVAATDGGSEVCSVGQGLGGHRPRRYLSVSCEAGPSRAAGLS